MNADFSGSPKSASRSKLIAGDEGDNTSISQYGDSSKSDKPYAGKWPHELAEKAVQLLQDRQRRGEHFDLALFGEPGWDILLFLYASHRQLQSVSVSEINWVCRSDRMGGRRWIRVLEQEGLVEVDWNENDDPRSQVALSEGGQLAMTNYLAN